MRRWMCGVTKTVKIRNEHVRGSVKLAPVTKEDHIEKARVVRTCQAKGRRASARCISTRKETERKTENQGGDSRKRDMESVGLKEEDAPYGTKCKNDIQNHSASPDDGKSPGRRRSIRRSVKSKLGKTFGSREASDIKIGKPAMNRDQGYELPQSTANVLLSCDRR